MSFHATSFSFKNSIDVELIHSILNTNSLIIDEDNDNNKYNSSKRKNTN
jgi:hypothetical protein